ESRHAATLPPLASGFFFFSRRRRHPRFPRDWSSDVCSSDLVNAKVYTVQIGEGDDARVFRGFDLLGQPRYESRGYPTNPALLKRSEERRVGKECRAREAPHECKRQTTTEDERGTRQAHAETA